MLWAAPALAVVLTGLGAMEAAAQSADIRALTDRIERLQRDVEILQRQSSRSAPSGSVPPAGLSSSFVAQTDSRFEQIEAQVRELTGRVEELNHAVAQLRTRIDKLVGDVDFRLSALERGGATAPPPGGAAQAAAPPEPRPAASPPTDRSRAEPARTTQPPPQQAVVVPPGQPRLQLVPGPSGQPAPAAAPAALPAGNAQEQYRFAYNQLLQAQREQADFSRAEQSLRAFVAANPEHELAGNAQYWLGETFYVRRDYEQAAAAFAEGAKRYPRNEKAPDLWLKLGLSLAQLKRTRDACGALAELERRYPQAAPSIKQVATRERQRLAC